MYYIYIYIIYIILCHYYVVIYIIIYIYTIYDIFKSKGTLAKVWKNFGRHLIKDTIIMGNNAFLQKDKMEQTWCVVLSSLW